MTRQPRFWSHGNGGALATLLSPLSAITAAATARRVARPGFTVPIPVICCGNATVGGAGKTTLALDIASRLLARGRDVHMLTRGWGGSARHLHRVEPSQDQASVVGDEALLLAAIAPTWVSADRAAAARAATAAGAQVLVMDDGLQNPTLTKSLSLLVIDGTTGFGNGRVMPAGPLREPVSACAARAGAAVLIGYDRTAAAAALPPDLPILRARLVPGPDTAALRGRRVMAFAGIAHPDKFFAMLSEAGVLLVETQAFADHHPFSAEEAQSLIAHAAAMDAQPVTTPKDHVRLAPHHAVAITSLGVSLAWDDETAIDSLLATTIP